MSEEVRSSDISYVRSMLDGDHSDDFIRQVAVEYRREINRSRERSIRVAWSMMVPHDEFVRRFGPGYLGYENE